MAAPGAFAGLWSSLPTPLTEWVLDVVHSMGHTQMTPVQASTIPLFMKNKDVVVEAVTGSGKTLAFAIPVIERLIRRERRLRKDEIGALVISPTRELASQIHSIFSLFLSSQPGSDDPDSEIEPFPPPLLLVSSDKSTPLQDLKRFAELGSDIIIGTPGRIEEFLLGRGKDRVDVKQLEVLVLDEADRLLDLGFQASLTKIITHLPKQRRTGLFSATMTDADALSELVRVGLRNPARIVVKVQSKKKKGPNVELVQDRRTPANLQNLFVVCNASEKVVQLNRIIKHEMKTRQASRFIVYFATCACVDYFYKVFSHIIPNATFYSLHGGMQPSIRTRTLETFATDVPSPSTALVLLATDVAARGLDLPNVDSVIQFDPPTDTKAFSHRCGRTARAGRSGTAWTLLCPNETDFKDFLSVRKIPITQHPYLTETGERPLPDEGGHPEDPDVHKFLQATWDVVKTDRGINDKAMKAFVSFTRAYSKHEASYIFRVQNLDFVGVAKSYGLLRLPRMPELKKVDKEGWTDANVDWDTYSYLDKAQEAKRLQDLSEPKPDRPPPESRNRQKNTSWSGKEAKKQEKEKRKEKRKSKKDWLKSQQTPATTGSKRPIGAVDGGDDGVDDWKDYAREEKMAKRLRKGEVSKKDFDLEFGYA